MGAKVTIRPATPGRWPDVEAVLRDCADAARCWCAYWYLPNRDFKAGWGEANRQLLADRVAARPRARRARLYR